MTTLAHLAPTVVGVPALIVLITGVPWFARVPRRFAPALAILRGAVQLALLSVILSGIITPAWLVAVALAVEVLLARFSGAAGGTPQARA